ncbi:MAG: EAL domain-containing protein [Alphaproteobacteria bacterium]|nr:EAL domain-containing protein [Alphaproteobacteria bacterium]
MVAILVLLLVGVSPAAAGAVRIDPAAPRIDASSAVSDLPVSQALGEPAPGVTFFYVDLLNLSDAPQTRVLRFVDPAPGRWSLFGGTAQNQIGRVLVPSTDEPLEHVGGLSRPAVRIVLPAGGLLTVAFEVLDPSADAGVEIWNEPDLLANERVRMLRTTLLAGILLASAAYLMALFLMGSVPSHGLGAAMMTSALMALLAQSRVLGDAPLRGLTTAESFAAASTALAIVLAIAYMRRVFNLTLALPKLDRIALGIQYVGGVAGLLALVSTPGMRTLVAVLFAASIGLYLYIVRERVRERSRIALRHLPAGIVMVIAFVLGALHIAFISQYWPEFDVVVSGGMTVSLALLAFAAGERGVRGRERELAPVLGNGPIVAGVPREQDGRYALALAAAHQALWDWDIERDKLTTSATLTQMLGLQPGELTGSERLWAERIHAEDRPIYDEAMRTYRERGNVSFSLEFRVAHADQSFRWLKLRASCVAETQGAATRCVGVIVDETARKTHEQRLVQDALNDPLTRLPNRAILLDRLQRLIDSKRRGAPERAALLLLDLDRFRVINEGLGHAAGDVLLIATARRLERKMRPEDTLARLSGDEFAILMEGRFTEEAEAAANQLVETLAQTHEIEGHEIALGASGGLAVLRSDQEFAEDLLREAETAMYHAKRQGGRRVAVFSSALRPRASERLTLERDLRHALHREELEMGFQPIIALGAGEVAGYEGLMRWRHPTAGALDTETIVAIAEEAGLGGDLSRQMLVQAASAAARLRREADGEGRIFVAVNASARDLARPQFLHDVEQILQEYELEKGELILEITETAMMANPEGAMASLARLKELGAVLALDDFGTGFSSLAHLHRYPFDILKIDKTFIANLGGKGDSPTIVRTIIALGHELGLRLVAEGIEDEATARQLTALGCDFGQGYHFGGALTPRALFGGDDIAPAEKEPVLAGDEEPLTEPTIDEKAVDEDAGAIAANVDEADAVAEEEGDNARGEGAIANGHDDEAMTAEADNEADEDEEEDDDVASDEPRTSSGQV